MQMYIVSTLFVKKLFLSLPSVISSMKWWTLTPPNTYILILCFVFHNSGVRGHCTINQGINMKLWFDKQNIARCVLTTLIGETKREFARETDAYIMIRTDIKKKLLSKIYPLLLTWHLLKLWHLTEYIWSWKSTVSLTQSC